MEKQLVTWTVPLKTVFWFQSKNIDRVFGLKNVSQAVEQKKTQCLDMHFLNYLTLVCMQWLFQSSHSVCVKYKLNGSSKHSTAAGACDMQTTAFSWIKQTTVALVKVWWLMTAIKVKTIKWHTGHYIRCVGLLLLMQYTTNRVCALLAHWSL